MRETSHHDSLQMLRLRSLRHEMLALAERLGRMDGRLTSQEEMLRHLIATMLTGGQAFSRSDTQPRPPSIRGSQGYGPSPAGPQEKWKKRISDVGEIGHLISVVLTLVKGAIFLVPYIMLGVLAGIRLLGPSLWRFVLGFWPG